MPVTPFHLGPGFVVKAVCPGWFSIGVFTAVQFAIDLETVGNILMGRFPLHGPLHTVPGALLVALVLVVPARWFVPALARVAGRVLRRVDGYPGWLVPVATTPGWIALFVGAVIGALSHVALDATIHSDVRPLGARNPLFVPGGFVMVHALCVVTGAIGALIWMARVRFARRAS